MPSEMSGNDTFSNGHSSTNGTNGTSSSNGSSNGDTAALAGSVPAKKKPKPPLANGTTSNGNSNGNGTSTTSTSKNTNGLSAASKPESMNLQEMMVFRGGKWVTVPSDEVRGLVHFSQLKFFYANIIDYVRVLMCIIAGFTVLTDWHGVTAFLVLGSTLLDWIDGPVARKYGQCSIFGSGIDWVADILCQLVMIAWWIQFDREVLPWLLIVTSIEITTGFFDFAVTATAKYPLLKPGQTGFNIILEWSMPEGAYTHLGTFLWLAYPFYSVGRTLEYAYNIQPGTESVAATIFLLNRYLLAVPAFMYAWCECAYGIHIIRSWTEPSRKIRPCVEDIVYDDTTNEDMRGGFTNYGVLPEAQRNIISKAYELLKTAVGDDIKKSLESKEIFWCNVWQRVGKGMELPGTEDVIALGRDIANRYYNDGSVIDGIGYIINPVGSKTQAWHVDYSVDYSTIFIPVSVLTPNNATQYIRFPSNLTQEMYDQCTKNLDICDLDKLTCGYVLRQAIAPQFSVLRMDYGTIHRGITNTGTSERVVFYVSVKKNPDDDAVPDEPNFANFANPKM